MLKNKKATTNPKNNDDNCFQHAIPIALNCKLIIRKDPQRISKNKSFVDQYNLKEISFPSHKKAWKAFEINNKTVFINILYVSYNSEECIHFKTQLKA